MSTCARELHNSSRRSQASSLAGGGSVGTTLNTERTYTAELLVWKEALCLTSKASELACVNDAPGSLSEYHALACSSMACYQHADFLGTAKQEFRPCLAVPGTVLAAKTFAARTSSVLFWGAHAAVLAPASLAWLCQDSSCSHQLSGASRCRRSSTGTS